ncbi:MAG: hypothetical protein Q7U95_07495 [Candidatus Oleimmundimicrobium sp.]|nr:hypothetical protein [Candidatus Oleimmundimicrobium sp.]
MEDLVRETLDSSVLKREPCCRRLEMQFDGWAHANDGINQLDLLYRFTAPPTYEADHSFAENLFVLWFFAYHVPVN